MRLNELQLENYRSFPALSLKIGQESVHALIGSNGSGKTNILESIGMLSLAASFLGIETDFLPHWGKDHLRVRGTFLTDAEEELTAEVVWQRLPRRTKAFFVNDVRTPSTRFIGVIPVLTFLPSDLQLFTGSPAARRAFLDDFLTQMSPAFRAQKKNYEDVLKQRNALLRNIADGSAKESDLDLWDERLSEHGAAIRAERRLLLKTLQGVLPDIVTSLAEHPSSVVLAYKSKSEATEAGEMRRELLEHLTHYRPRDIIIGSTTVGPHRDDWEILADGHALGVSASRGQQRAYLLALLFARADMLTSVRGERPIILLDDVFSELDQTHGEALMKSLAACQIFLSTTHEPPSEIAYASYAVSPQRVESGAARAAV